MLQTARQGEQISVIGVVKGEIPAGWEDNDNWYVVKLNDGTTGFVYSALVSSSPPISVASNTGVVSNTGSHTILITGPESFKANIKSALDLLKNRDPDSYEFVGTWLDTIIEGYVSCQYVGGATARIGMGCLRAGWSALAATIVHEACHAMRTETGLQSKGLIGERACLTRELETLRAIDPGHSQLAQREKVLRNIGEGVCQWWRLTFNRQRCLALP